MRHRRIVLAAVACLLPGLAGAEVSVDRLDTGEVVPFFKATHAGPWTRIRPAVPAADILNEFGDFRGDGFPRVLRNKGTLHPEACWPSAGSQADLLYAIHDGISWGPPINLSNSNNSSDTMPTVGTDPQSNRFIAWDRERNRNHAAMFTALSGDAAQQTAVVELSTRPRQGRRPTLAVADDGLVYVGYEETTSPSDDTPAVAIDKVTVPRLPTGIVSCGGEIPIDVVRLCTIPTHLTPDAITAAVKAESDSGHVWVTWIDSATQVGWVEVMNGSCSPPGYKPYTNPGQIGGIRRDIGDMVTGK